MPRRATAQDVDQAFRAFVGRGATADEIAHGTTLYVDNLYGGGDLSQWVEGSYAEERDRLISQSYRDAAAREAEQARQQYLEAHPDTASSPDTQAGGVGQAAHTLEQGLQALVSTPFAGGVGQGGTGAFASPTAVREAGWQATEQARANTADTRMAENLSAPLTASQAIQQASKMPPDFLRAAQLAIYQLGGGALRPPEQAMAERFLKNFTPEQAQKMAHDFHEAAAKAKTGKMATAAAMAVAMAAAAFAAPAMAALAPTLGSIGAGAAVGAGGAAASAGTRAAVTGDVNVADLATQILLGAAGGAAGPALATTGLNPALTGAAAGAAGAAARGAAGGNLDWLNVLMGAAPGALSGLSQSLGGSTGPEQLGGPPPAPGFDLSKLMPWLKQAMGLVGRGAAGDQGPGLSESLHGAPGGSPELSAAFEDRTRAAAERQQAIQRAIARAQQMREQAMRRPAPRPAPAPATRPASTARPRTTPWADVMAAQQQPLRDLWTRFQDEQDAHASPAAAPATPAAPGDYNASAMWFAGTPTAFLPRARRGRGY